MNYEGIIELYQECLKLEEITRKGWQMTNVPAERPESVADHTFQTMVLASLVIREFNVKIDTTELFETLLFHDIGEIKIGDISIKEANYNDSKKQEAIAVREKFNKLSPNVRDYYFGLWEQMDNKTTEVGRFAYYIDKLDAVIKAGIYEEKYNLNGLFDEFYTTQKERGTFENTPLEDFYDFIEEKFSKTVAKK